MMTTLDGVLDFGLLLVAGVLGSLVVEPAKVAVRITTERMRRERRS